MVRTQHALVFVAFVSAISILACGFPGLGATATEVPTIPPTDPPPTEPPTVDPAATEPPSETQPPAEAPTATPVPGPDFSAASVYAVSHLENGRLLVTIQVPGGVQGPYQATVGPSTLSCEILSQYPDRLYCNGPEPYQNYTTQHATVTVISSDSGETVFQAEFDIPPRPTPTPSPTPTYTPTPTPTYTPAP